MERDNVQQLEELVYRIQQLNRPPKFFWNKWGRKKSIANLLSLIDKPLLEYLKTHDPEVSTWALQNRELLERSSGMTCKVTDEGGSPMTKTTKRFKGKIHANGYLYLKAMDNLPDQRDFFNLTAPKIYKGVINELGEVDVYLVKAKFGFVGGRLPREFKAQIFSSGRMELGVTQSDWDWTGGHAHVSKMVGDPFAGDPARRKKFLKNRQFIRERMADWKRENGLESQPSDDGPN